MKQNKIYIYCIYFPTSNKYYVGQTKNLKRLFSHLNSKLLVGNALQKYDDWQVTILHTCKTRDAANLLEIEDIRNLNCIKPNGYNLTAGGDGGDTFTNNPNKEEIRKNQSEKMQGKQNALGHKCSEKSKEKNRQSHLGKTHSKETIIRMSILRQGENNPMFGQKRPDVIERNKNPNIKEQIKRLQNKILKLERER